MAKLGSLESIRAQFSKKPCPKCGMPLTVEKTEFYDTEICEHCLDHTELNQRNTCCDNVDLQMVKFITSNDAIQVRNQCQGCGFITPNSIGGVPSADREKLPLADLSKKEQRNEKKYAQSRSIYARTSDLRKARFDDNKVKWFEDYTEYLKSPEWQKKRLTILKRDGYLCQCCLDAYATQVHHKSYEFVDFTGREPAFDLVAVCKPCHDFIEETKKARKQAN